MSCGMAAVARMTSVGREPLILSRVGSKGFWLLYPNLMYHSCFPTPPHPLNTEHLVFLLLIYACTKTTLYDPSHSGWMRMLSLCSGWDNGLSPDKNRCVCKAPPRPLWFTPCPLRITSEWVQVPLVLLQIKHSHLLHWTILLTKRQAVNNLWFFLANVLEQEKHTLQMDYVKQALPSKHLSMKCSGNVHMQMHRTEMRRHN